MAVPGPQLQRRPDAAAQIAEQVQTSPASYVAFDVLAVDGVDVRTRPWAARRALLEQLGVDWRPPLQLTPVTFDRDEAEQWSRDYRPLGRSEERRVGKEGRSRGSPDHLKK